MAKMVKSLNERRFYSMELEVHHEVASSGHSQRKKEYAKWL